MLKPRHDHQVGDNDAPADPSFKAFQTMIGATRQLDRAADNADAAFNAIAKALTLPEPGLSFMRPPLISLVTGLWDANLLNAELTSQLFIRWREQTLVACQNPRPTPEAFLMAVQDSGQELIIWRVASRNSLPVTDQAVFHFGIIDLVAELGVMRVGFAPTNNLGMRFKETDHFRVCRE